MPAANAEPISYAALFRVTRFNGRDVPCVIYNDFPATRGNLAIMDEEGFNECSLDYYRRTRPAKTPEEFSECERLAHAMNTLDLADVTAFHPVKKLSWLKLRSAWAETERPYLRAA